MPRNLFTGPVYIYLKAGTKGEIILTPDDQMGTATITDTEEFTEQMTQSSTAPADQIVSGYRFQMSFSLARVWGGDTLEIIEEAYHGAAMIRDPEDESRKALGFFDRAGCPVDKFPVLLKAAQCEGPTRNPDLWWYIPYAAMRTQDASFTFSNTEQTSTALMIDAFPPPAELALPKVIRGDYTLYGIGVENE
jgi:hypothetical protein